MKSIKRFFSLLFLITLSVTALQAQNYSAAQVRQRINNMAARTRTMTCTFVQTKSMRMMKNKIVSHGRMYYSRPNKLRWEYTSPYRYTFILNGNSVRMKNSKGSRNINVNQSKMFKEITRIMMSSVLGSCVSNSRDFKVSLQGHGNNWQAVMTPRRNPMKQMFRSIIVKFDMRRTVVSSVRMIERNGDTTLITLQNIRTNTRVNASVFNLR